MTRNHWLVAAALFVAVLLGACRSAPPPSAGLHEGTWYTRFSLRFENNEFKTTNYRRGQLLPINSEVEFKAINRKAIVVRVKATGTELRIENVEKHTSQSVDQAFERLFSKNPIDLSHFTEAEQKAIHRGEVEVGMDREAVLAAIGYPPTTGTASLESDEWKYWDSTFTTFVVRFQDGRVAQIRN